MAAGGVAPSISSRSRHPTAPTSSRNRITPFHTRWSGFASTGSVSGLPTALWAFATSGMPRPAYGFQSGTVPSASARCAVAVIGSKNHENAPASIVDGVRARSG